MTESAPTYAGDVTPAEAYTLLEQEPNATLVDVRTRAEWTYVGLPDLSGIGKQVVTVEWLSYPDGQVNPDFVEQVRAATPDGGPLLLLCRSGVRSVAAAEALSAAGLPNSYNIVEGFEGGLDEDGHRSVNGWKLAGLPWRQ
ncbi:rhodanese-related sulfurtransferase [Branchiibius hedensis]|uniref:Rhodanese-related sulfurtransferase n=1 Tax=Branchiibius hedensis TaxID=672460 RepID=A0A2Y8ZSJ2_9MICO|nr:rhodanese-like domain-containing protein [Branchiibius hedensis]PWJ25455.1 rhodanese-related sulfurtransferase [Branchiibius hedensis]SSA34268.1 Rhodanese-related sulfurtransferase [Branchiibius hedensis]